MKVRSAVPADAARIAEIHVASWRVTYAGLLPAPFLDALDPASRADRWSENIQALASPSFVLVAESDDILGFGHFGRARDADRRQSGEMYAIYVDPTAIGAGVGRAILAEGERNLVRNGFADAIVWVLEDNTRARAFYEHSGWTAEDVTKTAEIGGRTVLERRHSRSLV